MLGALAVQQPYADLSDLSVIERIQCGDVDLFEVLMRRYNRRLFRVARAILHNDGLAEEVVHDAYTRAFAQLHQFSKRSAFSTWLIRVTINEAISRKRWQGRVDRTDDLSFADRVVESVSSSPVSALERKQIREILENAVDRLPEEFRLVMMLRDVEGLSTAEVADALQCSESLVKVRLHRAHQAMRKELESKFESMHNELFAFDGARCDRIVVATLQTIRETAGRATPPEGPPVPAQSIQAQSPAIPESSEFAATNP